MKRSLALTFCILSSVHAEHPAVTRTKQFVQQNPLSATVGTLALHLSIQLVSAQIHASWACAPERWSSWALARQETVPERIQKNYAEPLMLHELAGYYAALKDIDEELTCLLGLKATWSLVRNLVLPEELLDQRLLALIALKQEIVDLTTAVRTRLRARSL